MIVGVMKKLSLQTMSIQHMSFRTMCHSKHFLAKGPRKAANLQVILMHQQSAFLFEILSSRSMCKAISKFDLSDYPIRN